MGSKPVFARAGQAAYSHPSPASRLNGVHPRRWHPVVYLERGPVRFAGRDTVLDAMTEARSLAQALGARTWAAVPGRATILEADAGEHDLPPARRNALTSFTKGGAR